MQDSVALGVPAAIELWLVEDRARMEAKLTQKASAAQLVGLYARLAQVGGWLIGQLISSADRQLLCTPDTGLGSLGSSIAIL